LHGRVWIHQNLVHELPPQPDLDHVAEMPECHQTFSLAHVKDEELHVICGGHSIEDAA
jgi:hypothetical protein